MLKQGSFWLFFAKCFFMVLIINQALTHRAFAGELLRGVLLSLPHIIVLSFVISSYFYKKKA